MTPIEHKLKILNPEARKNISKLLVEVEKGIDLLYELATRDEKTGVYNHKFFQTIFEMEFDKALRGRQLSLMIIDLDHFKRINDTYGHLTGDKILKRLAEILTKQLRKYDIIARFGGEEFFIVYPNTSISKAKKVGERLRKAVENDKFMKKYNSTFSGGITEYKKGDTKSKMKERVDKALYQAKEAGRNRIKTL